MKKFFDGAADVVSGFFKTYFRNPLVDAFKDFKDTVLDPFNGLATTGLAAISQNRYYIGVDNNPRYIEQSKVRLNLFDEGHSKLQTEGQIINQAA